MSHQAGYPDSVRIVEVGLRDGLQNEQQIIPMQVKLSLLHRLEKTGLRTIELTGFVHPLWVPQLADAEAMLSQHQPLAGIQYPVLVPNLTGMQRALTAGAQEIAVFTAASEGFNQKNINCSIEESLQRSAAVIELAKANNLRVRGYISCVLGCPIDGKVKVSEVLRVAEKLLALGCDEISLGDTIGVGTPLKAKQMLEAVAAVVPMPQLAVHFHDTNGQALANILACLESGVQVIDSSIAGLGGCPYAPGATGNIASEDVVYMLNGMGIESGIDLDALVAAGRFISGALGRTNASAVGRAWNT
ncbi:MAG: hydroxymethylglutaryl-CoA lyase [Xanthomonadales bacterium]|nr:hydroxymethylglutaryl-CoA lyase [Xanthomonadales bacterium]